MSDKIDLDTQFTDRGQLLGRYELISGAYGLQKVENNFSLFDAIWTYNVPDREWKGFVNGIELPLINGNTYIRSEGGALCLEPLINEGCSISSKRHCRYQANRGILFSNSMILPNINGIGKRRWGLFTSSEGIFFELDNGILYAVLRTNSVDYRKEVDLSKFKNIDLSKGHLYDIQLKWRGIGNIKFYVDLLEVAEMKFEGKTETLTIENPTLPVSYNCINLGETGTFKLLSGCCNIDTEGGKKAKSTYDSIANPQEKNISDPDSPVLIIRVKKFFYGKENTRDVRFLRATLSADEKAFLKIYTTRDETALTGQIWRNIDNDSVAEYDYDATNLDITKCKLLHTRRIQQDFTETVESPKGLEEFILTSGDIIILTGNRENSTRDTLMAGTLEFGEEI